MKDFVQAVGRSLELLGGAHRGRWVLLVGLALAVTGFEAVGAMLIYVLLGSISGDMAAISLPIVGSLGDRFPGVPARTLQLAVAGGVGGFFVIRSAVVVGQQYVQSRVVNNAGARLANHLVRGYLSLPYLTHTQLNSAELVRNAFDSVQTLVRQVLKPAVEVLAELILVAGLTVVLLVVAPQATLIALAIMVPAIWALQALVQPRIKRLGRRSQDARRVGLQAMQQALGAVRDVRLLGREREFAAAFARQRRVMSRTEYIKNALAELPRALIETVLVLVIVVIFVLAVLAGEGLEAVVSTLGVFAYAGLRLQPSLRTIVQGLNHVRFGTAVLDDLLADRARVDAVLEARERRETPTGRRFERAVEFRGVGFRYAPDAPVALSEADLTIHKGEFVGVCGPTGGGKSTFVDLFVGLLQPTSGQVLVDGQVLDEDPVWWYAELGVVSQSVALIDDTLRRNIAFGVPDPEIDEEALVRSVRRAQLQAVVDALPEGLDTMVGERGVRLSGGQRQRVAIARALYRQPSVIVFDEGTSALDAGTESALVASLEELKSGRTLVSVAHRISTVKGADRIVIIDAGRIVAEGTYDELVRENALFRSLAR